MRLPKLNVALARKVKKHILAEPKRLRMSTFASDVSHWEAPYKPACNTIGCIAGWAVLLSHKKEQWKDLIYSMNFQSKATKLLGVTEDEAELLFLQWRERDGEEGAKEVAKKIDALIAARKKGEEYTGL